MFFAFVIATGLSITSGLPPTLCPHVVSSALAGSADGSDLQVAAFENSCNMAWFSDHRRHHKHVDHDDDPYDISKGFWRTHIGWILFKLDPEPPLDNVADSARGFPLVMWQCRFYLPLAIFVGFLVPAGLGYCRAGWIGALGGFLLGGVARITAVQHMTFFIQLSLSHDWSPALLQTAAVPGIAG